MKIQIENVTKKYKDITVLNDVSIDIENVKTIGIIGESGCGKSTLLRQLAGIETPEKGTIVINGLSPISDKKQFQKEIGYVFQKHNLFPHLTIRKNLNLILETILKIKKEDAKKKIDDVVEMLKIKEIEDKFPNEVSGGQAQRASIARALVTDAKLIFLDEPTASLDPLLTNEVLKSIGLLKEKGIEFIFITHEISFLKKFADYIIFMDSGKIVEHGCKDCLENPKTSELKKFLKMENL